MKSKNLKRVVSLSVTSLLVACNSGGSNNSTTSQATTPIESNTIIANLSTTSLPSNATPLTVDSGPLGTSPTNVSYISITLCNPGTTTCKTIDHIMVDSGSSGLRLISSALSGLNLPPQKDPSGNNLYECLTFGYGYNWGPVALADLQISGEKAANIPIHVMGTSGTSYTNFAVPTSCSDNAVGPLQNTVSSFGANGIIGVNSIPVDNDSSLGSNTGPGYYSCSGSSCTSETIANNLQVGNPVAKFTQDNNGVIFKLPAVSGGGQATLSGQLVFGINTETNNQLNVANSNLLVGNANTIDTFINTTFNGTDYTQAALVDSGTSTIYFPDSSLTKCGKTSAAAGFYCPSTTTQLSATLASADGTNPTNMNFEVVNALTAFNNTTWMAIPGIASTGTGQFIWGLPTFYGHNVYVAIDGATVPNSINGPFVGYGSYSL